ncbi:MAG: class I SAM-dependent methyltransferase [Patescibacteria group bacterium]|jgi:SAM-dependent methyltransferase
MTKNREIDETTASWSYAELWDKYPIPARPDDEELEIEKKEILASDKSPSEMNVMILGSTIEYRSLCKKIGTRPYVVDFAKENFDALTSYAEEKFEQEHFVEADWLEINYQNYFDFILGHRPFNVIRRDQVRLLFQKMYDSLKVGGVFFCRGNVLFPTNNSDLMEAVNKWGLVAERPYRLFSYLEVPLYIHCADKEGYLDYPKARMVIKQLHEQGKMSDEDYKDIQPLISMAAGTKFRSYVTKEEIQKNIEAAGFNKVEWLFTSHEFTRNMPIIKLTK